MTIRDIAKLAGVSQPVISAVLNNNYKSVKVAKATRKRIQDIVKEHGYYRNASATALSTGKTGYIGFLLSDVVHDGFSNHYYLQPLTAIERVCRKRGYGLHVSTCNLSDIESFVVPEKVGNRCVDGFILAGPMHAGILEELEEFGIPAVCIGMTFESAQTIPSISSDTVGGWLKVYKYLSSLGHQNVAMAIPQTPWNVRIFDLARKRLMLDESTRDMNIISVSIPERGSEYEAAQPAIEKILNIPEATRPTAVIGSDQFCVAAYPAILKCGLKCPEDMSIVSSCDSVLVERFYPAITSLHWNMFDIGKAATELLLDHVINNEKMGVELSQDNFPCSLVVRDSAAPPPAK